MPSALQTANFFLTLADPDAGDSISNLKLQKLLYYAQGVYLAIVGQPLFPEAIEAWQHGPVVPVVYRHFKQFGSGPVALLEDLDTSSFDQVTRDILDDVYQVYGQFSAWKLRDMTHGEPPWVNTPPNEVISHAKLKEFFQTRIKEHGEE